MGVLNGANEGDTVGEEDGLPVGVLDGANEGDTVGVDDGLFDRLFEGKDDGLPVGVLDGDDEGDTVGEDDGPFDGLFVGQIFALLSHPAPSVFCRLAQIPSPLLSKGFNLDSIGG
jgi:hypothetical protein